MGTFTFYFVLYHDINIDSEQCKVNDIVETYK